MDEEQTNLPPPPRFRYKLLKIMTLTLFFLALFASIGFTGLKATSSSSFCSSCHEMKPEFYTWKASTHSEVDCVNCHVKQGVKNLANEKKEVIVDAYKKKMGTYISPIHMASQIPDSSCERCHNVNTREFTPSGDIIIPHVKHKNKGIQCVQCHSGVAHGKVADRKMTYQADYDRWDQKLGTAAMSDFKFIRPDMDTCMECHEARKATLQCKACHETTMVPKTHKTETFKAGGHGKIQPSELKICEKCHSYMSTEKYDLFKEDPVYQKYLKNETTSSSISVTVPQYAKTNTFCKKCHGKKPVSHKIPAFITKHGTLSKDTKRCFTCHENRITSDSPVTKVQCSTCHKMKHKENWRKGHPIEVSENQRFGKFCLKCHVEKTCASCHRK
jgi:nitrate/TMAO reductase-like tetraheme cytochrome c subunit/nitrate reductase cytochrome c-type subunit